MNPRTSSTKKPAEQVMKEYAVRPDGFFQLKIKSGSCWTACAAKTASPNFAARKGLHRASITHG